MQGWLLTNRIDSSAVITSKTKQFFGRKREWLIHKCWPHFDLGPCKNHQRLGLSLARVDKVNQLKCDSSDCDEEKMGAKLWKLKSWEVEEWLWEGRRLWKYGLVGWRKGIFSSYCHQNHLFITKIMCMMIGTIIHIYHSQHRHHIHYDDQVVF